MKLKTWTSCKATPEGITVEGHTFAWRGVPAYDETAPLVLIRTEGRPNGWASAPASIEQLSTLALEAYTDGQEISALRPGEALRRGYGACWSIAPEVGI